MVYLIGNKFQERVICKNPDLSCLNEHITLRDSATILGLRNEVCITMVQTGYEHATAKEKDPSSMLMVLCACRDGSYYWRILSWKAIIQKPGSYPHVISI